MAVSIVEQLERWGAIDPDELGAAFGREATEALPAA
jgi:hypothetical protein